MGEGEEGRGDMTRGGYNCTMIVLVVCQGFLELSKIEEFNETAAEFLYVCTDRIVCVRMQCGLGCL